MNAAPAITDVATDSPLESSEASIAPAPPVHAPTPGLGKHVVSGMAVGMVCTFAQKVLALLQQLAIGYALTKDQVGLVGLAYGVVVFATVLRDGGVGVVLVQRGNEFSKWANPAVWISSAIALLTLGLSLVAIPIALHAYDPTKANYVPWQLIGVLLVIAASGVPSVLSAVPAAKLNYDLKFNYLSITGTILTFISTVLTIAMAFAGAGAFAIVVPACAVAFGRLILYWAKSPVHVSPNPELGKWKNLLGDSLWATAAASALAVWVQLDRVILGLFRDVSVVGDYQYAWMLTSQTATLLAGTAGTVLMPAFGRISDPQRQVYAFERTTMLLGLVAVPACFLQGWLCEPALQLFFGHKWDNSVWLTRMLSFGLSLGLMGIPTNSFLQGRGKFKLMFWWQVAEMIGMAIFATIGAWLGGAMGVAIANSTLMTIFTPLGLWIVFRGSDNVGRRILRLLGIPVVIGMLTTLLTWAVVAPLPGVWTKPIVQIVVVGSVFCGLTFVVGRLIAPREVAELVRLSGIRNLPAKLLARLRRTSAA
ncbi:MAG: oligosaccharide flippase family protein [Tepidisphaeraceae bacterium]